MCIMQGQREKILLQEKGHLLWEKSSHQLKQQSSQWKLRAHINAVSFACKAHASHVKQMLAAIPASTCAMCNANKGMQHAVCTVVGTTWALG